MPFSLTEGDIVCIFSQYGEIIQCNLIRDKETGKSRGFGFLCYDDQRSTDLAVDNFNGTKIVGRTIRVDHVQNYKVPKYIDKMDQETLEIVEKGIGPKIEESDGGRSTSPEVVVKKEKKVKKKKKRRRRSDSSSSDESKKKKLRKSREKRKSKKKHQKEDSSSESYKEEDHSRSDGKLENRQNISKSFQSFNRDASPEHRRIYTQQREKQREVRVFERSKWGSGRQSEPSEERDRDKSGRKNRYGDNHERGHRSRDSR
ncbi:RNA-binding motif protein, X-linked 2-like isoform X2 [Artemia franciscana]|nr:hypothetical protein QYM36_003601 [Artemia franciscana]